MGLQQLGHDVETIISIVSRPEIGLHIKVNLWTFKNSKTKYPIQTVLCVTCTFIIRQKKIGKIWEQHKINTA